MTRITNEVLFRHARPYANVGPLDGQVGAIIMDGEYFITSANQECVFSPPLGNQRQVRLCADSRYGQDDPILWPQPYVPYYAHFGAIPRPGSLPFHEIIWWTPTKAHFDRFESASLSISGIGKLSPAKLAALRYSTNYILHRTKAYLAATPQQRQPRQLEPLAKWLEQGLIQLESVNTTFRRIEFILRDVQRVWLDIQAILDYMEIYKPRMDGRAAAASQVADTIGVFTHNARVAQDFFVAGLPCWLIRPSSELTDQNILRVIEPVNPEDRLVLGPHPFPYPVIFTGSASALEKYGAMTQYSRNFLCFPDPFNGPTTQQVPSSSSKAPSLPTSGPATGARSSGQLLPVRSSKSRRHTQRGQMEGAPKGNRDKFQPATNSPIALVPIAAWGTALTAVDQNPARVLPRFRTPHDRKYIFPEPGIFVAANEMRRARYFSTWQAIEPACIYRLSASSDATPLSNQEWRDVLIGNIASKSSTTKSALAREQAHRLLGSAINDMGIEINDISPSLTPPPLEDTIARQILWRLTELNFRFELLALDLRAGPANRGAAERQEAIRDCLQVEALLVVDPEAARRGLQSDDWRLRLPCLLKLRSLMGAWEGVKPAGLLESRLMSTEDYQESDVSLLENAVARFYTDSFFLFFGRAAIIPARLH